MEITFLGTGGCRVCMLKQRRQTGGMIFNEEGFMMSVDPGPGALVHGIKNGIDLGDLDAIFVSHPHLDHEGDVEVMIEAMTHGCISKKGYLISNRDYLSNNNVHSAISNYHREAIEKEVCVEEGDVQKLKNGLRMEIKEVIHKDVITTGFKLSRDGKTFSYIPDTSMFDGLIEKFDGSDYMVISCPRTHKVDWIGHLGLKDVVEIAEKINPEKIYINHLSNDFIDHFEEEKRWIAEQGMDDTIKIPDDNQSVEIDL